MGWASCGRDGIGRLIGYAHRGRCDHPGCSERIDRGLAYACGGEHGGAEKFCEGYFCPRHLYYTNDPELRAPVCLRCSRRVNLAQSGKERSACPPQP